MRNLWKGFVVGSVVGATIGFVVDSGSKASNRLAQAASDADLGSKARELGERAASSDVVKSATERAHEVAHVGADGLHHAKEAVDDLASKHSSA
jgi:hypothetical protein